MIQTHDRLLGYMVEHGIKREFQVPSAPPVWTASATVAAVETHGAILFADLPDFTRVTMELKDPVASAFFASHFFAWVEERVAKRALGGIVDKYIGDELMMVFPHTECKKAPPLESAMMAAEAILSIDPFGFDAKIGIAEGSFAITLVGTGTTAMASAMGHTVNLAARCVPKELESAAVRIANANPAAVRQILHNEHRWGVISDTKPFKNIGDVAVVTAVRQRRTPVGAKDAYLELVRGMVADARSRADVIVKV